MENYYALIMAGGGGTRLWPMSRNETPKQFLPLVEDHSMFKTSVDRLEPLFPPERIYIIAARKYIDILKAEAPHIPQENFIAEPSGRDTTPAISLAVAIIHKRHPEAVVAVLTSDHHIARKNTFLDVLAAAYSLADEDYIVTLGISPSYPATGFGYIRQGDALDATNGFQCFTSRGFTEKPNLITATGFVASGEYTWNSGMFIWKTARAIEEIARQQPEIYELMLQLQAAADTTSFEEVLDTLWSQMPRISLDFAIMEGARNLAVIPVDIGWSDVGSWRSLFDVLPQDKFGNCFKGKMPERVILDTNNTMVYSDRLTVTIGVADMIVVDTEDVLLICHRDRSQDVREVVEHLRSLNREEYL